MKRFLILIFALCAAVTAVSADEYDKYVARFAGSLPYRVYFGKVRHHLPMNQYVQDLNMYLPLHRLNSRWSPLSDSSYYIDYTRLQSPRSAYLIYFARPEDSVGNVVFELPDHKRVELMPNDSKNYVPGDSSEIFYKLIVAYRDLFQDFVDKAIPASQQGEKQGALIVGAGFSVSPMVSYLNDKRWGTGDWILAGLGIAYLIDFVALTINDHRVSTTTNINELRDQLRAWDAVETKRRLEFLRKSESEKSDSTWQR